MFFNHFASKNQLHGFYISGTLVENELNKAYLENMSNKENATYNKISGTVPLGRWISIELRRSYLRMIKLNLFRWNPRRWEKVFQSRQSKFCGRPYPFRFFKGCLPQNSLSPLLNTLSHIQRPHKNVALNFRCFNIMIDDFKRPTLFFFYFNSFHANGLLLCPLKT